MSFEERNSLSGLAASILAWSIIGGTLWQRFHAGVFAGPDGPMLWARQMLWLMAIGIGVAIVLTIVFAIVDGLINGKDAVSTRTDERDQMIGLLGNRIVLAAMSAGVILAILLLALGWPVVGVLTLIVASCAIGDSLGTGYKVWRYRRGF